MIVIKPIAVNSGNLTTSTIPEPDASVGEVEWALPDPESGIFSDMFWSLCTDGAFIYAKRLTGSDYTIYQLGLDMIATGFTFDITAAYSGDIFRGMTFDGTFFYIITSTDIKKFSSSWVYDSVALSGLTDGLSVEFCGTYFVVLTAAGRNANTLDQYNLSFSTKFATAPIEGGSGRMVGMSYNIDYIDILLLGTGSVNRYDLALNKINVSYIPITNTNFSSAFDLVVAGAYVYTTYQVSGDVTGFLYKSFADTGETSAKIELGTEMVLAAEHKRYSCAVRTADSPDIGAAKSIPSWVVVQPTNKYAAFDDVISTQSISQLTQSVEITPAKIIGGVAVINLSGVSSANVTMTDPIDGIVYDRDVDLNNNINIINWFNYLWTGFDFKTEFVLLDLPPYSDAVTKITFTGASEIGVGALVIGPAIRLGVTNYGTNVQQLDFNKYEEDQFGNVQVIPRPYAKLVNFQNTVPKASLPYVFNQLEQLRGVAAVWVGDETDENDFTLVYGSHRDNTLNIDSPTACSVPLQIRGRI